MANSDELLLINSEITMAIQELHIDITSQRAVSTLTSHFCILKGLHAKPASTQKRLRKCIRFQINTHISQKFAQTNSAYGRFL
ncbi:hypothetical protein F8V45_25175 [Salmonella enterica]|nr:hypothetical protein [Salmonella enterica]